MQISTKGRYALRLMLDLAVHNTGELVKIKDIAARQGISEKYLEQIISSLKMLDEAMESVLDKVTLQDLKDWYEQMGNDYVI